MINPHRCLELYLAVTNHFNPKRNYDFFRYAGKVRLTPNALDNRPKDKFFFESLADKSVNEEYCVGYMVSNILKGNTYIRHMKEDEYNKWIKYRDAISYNFKDEMVDYMMAKSQRRNNSDTPALIELWYAGTISSEFVILYDLALNGGLFKKYDSTLTDNLLWDEAKKKLGKYRPFLEALWHIDGKILVEIQNIIRKSLTE